MRKLFLLFLIFILSAQSARADLFQGGVLPNGFPQDTANLAGANEPYLTAVASGLANGRLLSPTARFIATDNGPGGSYVLELATVTIPFGGTGATTQQGAVNAVLGFAGVATGDLVKYDGTNWIRLPRGTSNQILAVNAGGTDIAYTSTAVSLINANAQFIVSASDVSIPNADILTGGDGIDVTNGVNLSTIDVDATVIRTTGAQSLAGVKTFTDNPHIEHGNVLVFEGSGFNTSITKTDPTATRDFNLPDVASGDFLMTTGVQTITAVKTFSAAPVIATITNTGTLTLPTSTDTLIGRATTDTLTNKTITSPVLQTQVTLDQTTADYLLTWNNPGSAGTRNIFITDVGSDADFVMLNHNDVYTAGGIFYGNGFLAKITGAGSSGQALISAGAGAPAFGTLGVAAGGTGATTLTIHGVLIGNTTGAINVSTAGTAGQVFTSNGAAADPTFQAATSGGTVTSFSATPTAIFDVATATTTPALSLDNQSANLVLAGPASGAAATPTFRLTVDEDLPQEASTFGGTGGTTSVRALPTSGTLTGPYWNKGNYTTTGVITCIRCRLYVDGTVTISNAITVNTELPGGVAGVSSGGESYGQSGAGIGGGEGGPGSPNGTETGGGGGSFGGLGGRGGADGKDAGPQSGPTYDIMHQLCGSGGAGGGTSSSPGAGAGGGGGGGFYLEATGAISIDANITSAGGAGTNGTAANDGAGGGGSGGGVDIRSLSTVTIQATRTVACSGGAGGTGGDGTGAGKPGGGGGGGGGYIAIHGSTVTNNGTVTVAGGAAGTGGEFAAVAGSTGTTLLESTVWHVRSAP